MILSAPRNLGPAPLGEEDQAGTPVARIGSTLDVAVLFEVVDQVAHRLFGDLGAFGELGEARALRLDVLEDRGVGGADVVEASLGQALCDSQHDLLEWAPQQDADVGALVARFAASRSALRASISGCFIRTGSAGMSASSLALVRTAPSVRKRLRSTLRGG